MRLSQILSFAVGPIANALLSLVTLPLIAWLFTPEDVGRMSMINVALSFCILLCSLGLDQAYVREYHSETSRGALLRIVALPGLIVLLFICLGFSLIPGSLAQMLLGQRDNTLSFLIMGVFFCAFLSRFLSLSLRMEGRGLAFSMSQLAPRLVMLCFLGGYSILSSHHTLLQLITAWAIGVVAATAALVWFTSGEWKAAFNDPQGIARLRGMLMFGLPLIPGGLAFWGASTIDRVFVRMYGGFDELAIFSIAISVAGVAGILQSVFTTVWIPVIYQLAGRPEGVAELVSRMTRWMTIIIVCLFSVAGLLSWMVRYFLPESYVGIENILVACLGFPLLLTLSEVTSVGIGLKRKTIYLLLTSILTLILNVSLNLMLVPSTGAGGAAAATCLSFWIFLVLRTECSVRIWHKLPRFESYFFTLFCVCTAAMSSITGNSNEKLLAVIWFFLILSVIFRHRNFIYSELLLFRERRLVLRGNNVHE